MPRHSIMRDAVDMHAIREWRLCKGFIGEGMTFTEKEIALRTQVINNYTNNFYSDTKDVSIHQGNEV